MQHPYDYRCLCDECCLGEKNIHQIIRQEKETFEKRTIGKVNLIQVLQSRSQEK